MTALIQFETRRSRGIPQKMRPFCVPSTTLVSPSLVVKEFVVGLLPATCLMADMHFSYRVQIELEILENMYDIFSLLVSVVTDEVMYFGWCKGSGMSERRVQWVQVQPLPFVGTVWMQNMGATGAQSCLNNLNLV